MGGAVAGSKLGKVSEVCGILSFVFGAPLIGREPTVVRWARELNHGVMGFSAHFTGLAGASAVLLLSIVEIGLAWLVGNLYRRLGGHNLLVVEAVMLVMSVCLGWSLWDADGGMWTGRIFVLIVEAVAYAGIWWAVLLGGNAAPTRG